ncbi:MAG: PAS domain S-box protein [Acidobacteriota bacterium]
MPLNPSKDPGELIGEIPDRSDEVGSTDDHIRTSEIRYRRLFESARDGILILDAVTRQITDVNPFMTKLLGYQRDEFLGKELWQFGFFTDKKASKHAFRELQKNGYLRYDDLPLKSADGEPREVEFISNVYDEAGRPVIQCNIRDITGRRQTEAEQLSLEKRYHTLFEYAPDGIVIASPQNYYLDANASMCRMLGYDHGELIGMHASDIVTAPEIKHIESAFAEIKASSDYHREWQFRRKDGSEFPGDVIVTIMPDGNLLGMIRDITERRNAQIALVESDQKFHQLADNITDVFWIRSPDMAEIYYISPAYEQIWGRTLESDHAHPGEWFDLIFPPDRPIVERAYAGLMSDKPKIEVEYRILRPDGEQRWVRARGFQVKDPDGVIIRLAGIVTDITEKKQAETEIELTLLRLTDAQRIGKIGDWAWDSQTGAIRWSKEVFKIVGRDPALGPPKDYEEQQACYDVVSRKVMDASTAKAMESGKTQEYELVIVRPDGEREYVQAICEAIKNEHGEVLGLRGTIQNISTRKRADAALKKSEFRYRSLFESMIEGYAYCELIYADDGELIDLIYLEVNRAFGELTGLTDALGKKVTDLIPTIRETNPELFTIYGDVVRTGEPAKFETYLAPLAIWLYITIYSPDREHLVAVFENITERKVTAAALAENAASFRSLFETSSDAIFVLNEGYFLACNPSAELLFGCDKDKIIGQDPSAFSPRDQPDGRLSSEMAREHIQRAMAGVPQFFGWKHKRLDGTLFDAEVSLNRVNFDGATHIQATVRDISARKFAADELQRQQAELRVLFDLMPAMIWFKDTKNNILRVNERVAHAAGLPIAEIEGKASAKIYPDEAEKFYADDRLVIESRKPRLGYVETVPGPDGANLWVQTDKVPYFDSKGEVIGIVVMSQDVTERMTAAATLNTLTSRTKTRERMLTTLLSSMSDFAQIYDRDGRIVFVNQPLLDLWGQTLDEVIGKDFHDLDYPAELAETLQSELTQVFKTKESVSVETSFTDADDLPGYYEYIFSPAIGTDGNVDFVVGSTRNVTERRRGEQKLKSIADDLSRSQQIAHLGSWEMDIPERGDVNNGKLIWSDEVFRIFGYQPHEIDVTNELFFNAVHPDDRASVADAMTNALRDGTDYHLEHRISRPDGSERSVREHSEIVRNENGKTVKMVGTIQDITDQNELGEQLRHSQKMEAVGILAGGIAHDFNNLLTAINGYSDLTLKKMDAADPLRQNIQEVKNAGVRGAELTSQLLAFSRKQVLRSAVINLNTVVSNIENMLRRILRESVDLRIVLDPKLGNVKADAGQIEQVLMNLAINARDAMPSGGTLLVETENVYLEGEYVSHHLAVAPGSFIKLTVTDNGEGMDAATKARIFEPFFTTKAVGKGTGLGLSTVYGIVKQSGGDIFVYTEIGHGTSFKIYLPCVDATVEKPRWTLSTPQRQIGTETILVVEDEAVVRKLVCEILVDNGYTVLEANGSAAALEICRTHSSRIDMMLTDVIMPTMGGGQLHGEVVKILPEIKTLFMSGYSDDVLEQWRILDGHTAIIEKPFTPDGLNSKVRELFES